MTKFFVDNDEEIRHNAHMRIQSLMFVLLSAAAFAQTSPAFEAASVRPVAKSSDPFGNATRGGPGSSDPERLMYKQVDFAFLLRKAFGVKKLSIDGPAWINQDTYDIDAKIPPGTSEEQFELMFQNLLKERFDLKAHRENRQVAGYQLVIGKNGPKLKDFDPNPPRSLTTPTLGPDGVMRAPAIPTGRITGIIGPGHIVFARQPISALIDQLSN